MKNICVVGQGYVGLPLSLKIAEAGFSVVGIDVNADLVRNLNEGKSHIEDISDSQLADLVNSKKYYATDDFSVVSTASTILVCVPTPLSKNHLPDVSFLLSSITSIAKFLTEDSLVIIESTIEPGTTRDVIHPLLKKESGGKIDFKLAFSPERIDPRNQFWNLENTPKLVSGISEPSLIAAENFYRTFIKDIHVCRSLEVAETAKLLENTFRFINISFINEFAIFCQKAALDVNEVIQAAATKPYGFMAFYPGIGVGGHCIPVDPIYLMAKARNIEAPTSFIELADSVNSQMPHYYINIAEKMLGGLKEKKVLVIGIAYKPNVSDVRESAAIKLIDGLIEAGSEVFWHDELVRVWNNQHSVDITGDYDLAILTTPHDYLDLSLLGDTPILNTSKFML